MLKEIVKGTDMTFDQAVERIFRSAKRRFDYLAYEADFIEAFGTERGALIALNLMRELFQGYLDGKKANENIALQKAQFLCLGINAEIEDACNEILEATKGEQGAVVMLRVYDQMGMNIEEAFREVRKDLFQETTFPADDERQSLEETCLKPIIESALRTLPCYDKCLQKEKTIRPKKAEKRLKTIVRIALGFFEQHADVNVVESYILERMEKGTEPDWLNEILISCNECLKRELCALEAMGIGWDRHMPISEIASAIKFRLDH